MTLCFLARGEVLKFKYQHPRYLLFLGVWGQRWFPGNSHRDGRISALTKDAGKPKFRNIFLTLPKIIHPFIRICTWGLSAAMRDEETETGKSLAQEKCQYLFNETARTLQMGSLQRPWFHRADRQNVSCASAEASTPNHRRHRGPSSFSLS